ncbi:MAG: hypothetical protein ACOX4J_03505 [Anaerovoracaceae bacterium]
MIRVSSELISSVRWIAGRRTLNDEQTNQEYAIVPPCGQPKRLTHKAWTTHDTLPTLWDNGAATATLRLKKSVSIRRRESLFIWGCPSGKLSAAEMTPDQKRVISA